MAWKVRRGNIYHIGWREGGKDNYSTTHTDDPDKAEIKRLEKELELKIRRGEPVAEDSDSMSLKQLIDLFIAEVDVSPKTIRMYSYAWAKFISLSKIRTVDDTHSGEVVKLFKKNAALEKVSPMYVSLCLRAIRRLLAFALEKKIVKVNPFSKVKLPEDARVARIIDDKTVDNILDVSKPFMKRFIHLKLVFGLRLLQLACLNWNQYLPKERMFDIPKQKRQKQRYIPVLDEELKLLGTPRMSGLIFSEFENKTEKQISWYLERHWTKIKKKAGIKGRLRLHDLRHTCASNLSQKLRPHEVRDYFGWSTVAVVYRYTHSRAEDIRSKLESHRRELKGKPSKPTAEDLP